MFETHGSKIRKKDLPKWGAEKEGGREMSELQVPPSLLCSSSGLSGFESAHFWIPNLLNGRRDKCYVALPWDPVLPIYYHTEIWKQKRNSFHVQKRIPTLVICFPWDLSNASEPWFVQCILQMSVGRWLCAGAILDVGDISPLLFCSGKLDAGLRDLLQFQVASPAWFSIKGIGLELRKVNLGLLEPLLKLLEIAPLFFFFFLRKRTKMYIPLGQRFCFFCSLLLFQFGQILVRSRLSVNIYPLNELMDGWLASFPSSRKFALAPGCCCCSGINSVMNTFAFQSSE